MATTTVTLTSTCDANLSRSLAYENNDTHVREASFSSYLSSTEETFILKLAELTRNSSPTISVPQEPPSHYQISLERKKSRDGEISVFGAERYFNGGMDDDTPRIVEEVAAAKQHQRDHERPNLQFVKTRIKHGTPSTCSEVSGNSQSALLPSFLRDQSPIKQNRLQAKRFFASLGCNYCSCSDKKSICVEEDSKNSRNYKGNVDFGGFYGKEMTTKEPTKTLLQGNPPIDLVGIRVKQNQFKEDMLCEKFDKLRFSMVDQGDEQEEEKRRKSQDVFGYPIREVKLNNQDRGLNLLPWDGIPKIKDSPATSGGNGIYDLDMESDASSDLFEIESLSGNTNRCLTRQASDGMSSCVSGPFYEPSEASIDWSVVTASAANFSTVSDYDERGSVSSTLKNPNMISNTTTTTTTKTTMTKTRTTSTSTSTSTSANKERRPSILMSGCRNHKAVKVAADAYKMSENKGNPNTKRRQGLSDPLVPISRFQAETKAIDFESTNRNWGAFTTRSLPQSKSAHASHFLYMQ
ncbi:protein PHYTOCHROME KINASE SUBSTRATE 1-like [Macadamia integrifolia]|uniref:protein PHYTOCHROME KINASE SUBSTRATE 1-like n=1 Tax=Macadamia integrifolia TaxID=60698 RepID=UPI001C50035F|nr:protein PHYTOCHROME KINASE SUBSTRATE 1-like [Macadamia integrifolia]